MTIYPGHVGIDVSKNTLDVFETVSGRFSRIANDPAAFCGHVEAWRHAGFFVLFEATGDYDRSLRQALADAGVAFDRINPSRARYFAKFSGYLAKTDKIDARMLAEMARSLRSEPAPPVSADRERLGRLTRRRDQLVGMRQQEQVRFSECRDEDEAGDSLKSHLAWLDEAIKGLERQIKEHVVGSGELAGQSRLLLSIPGVGAVTAAVLMALMPELGSRSPKKLAALAGLAPFNHDSGKFRGQRSIQGGRDRVRRALYMAAVAAMRGRGRLAEKYKALIAAGKKPKVALIALARKILTIANAIVRDGKPFLHA
jgi:transposase